MAADDDPDGGGDAGRRKRKTLHRPSSSGESEEDEKERDSARSRGRGRSSASHPAAAGRGRSGSRGAVAPQQPPAERLRWYHPDSWDTQFRASSLAKDITDSIRAEFRHIGRLRGYSMEGDQSATTHVDDKTFKTTLQMHSEMCAVQATRQLLPASDAYGTASNPRGVEFSTDQPHCGYCTFFLSKLGLPLSQPTAGLFNLAGNCGYPLPRQLVANLAFLANVCSLSVAALVGKLNEIYVNTGAAPQAAFEANEPILKHVWRQVFAALNDTLPDLR